MSPEISAIYLSAAIVFCAYISYYAWRSDGTRGHRSFALACLTSMPWMVGELLAQVSSSFEWQWRAEVIRYFSAAILPVMLVIAMREYCGRPKPRNGFGWMFIVPVITHIVLVTNPWHHLLFKTANFVPGQVLRLEYGPYFWAAHAPYSYGMVAVCMLTVISELSRASRNYRRPLILLLVSLAIPVVVNLLGMFDIIGRYTAQSFPLFFSIMAYAIFRLKFLGGNPIAYETVFQTIRDGVLLLDREDVVRDVNPAAAKELGKEASEIVGSNVQTAFASMEGTLRLYETDPKGRGEIEITDGESSRYLLIDSTDIDAGVNAMTDGRIVTIRDITDRHRHQLSLEEMAFHDPLTRLANRRKFQEEVERAIDGGEQLAILYFDLNRFKAVNDSLGHDVGDELLKYVAARVASILRKPDMLGRLGGDEFAMLLHNCDKKGVELVIDRMLDNVQRPFKVGENTLIADVSIGAAYYPQNGSNLTELLRHADAEMYRAKQAAREPFSIIPTEIMDVSSRMAS